MHLIVTNIRNFIFDHYKYFFKSYFSPYKSYHLILDPNNRDKKLNNEKKRDQN